MAIVKNVQRGCLTLIKSFQPLLAIQCEKLHTSPLLNAWTNEKDGKKTNKWLKYNDVVFPPQKPNEPPRPAYVCHQKLNFKYSPWKMWYIATLVRGLPVDEAIRQLKFIARGGASHAREVLEQAKELAKKEHNVEYPSDMWVAEAFATKGNVIKGLRRHARCRPGIIEYWYCHFFVRLEEGIPPDNYYKHPTTDPKEQLENWLKGIRKRKIINSL